MTIESKMHLIAAIAYAIGVFEKIESSPPRPAITEALTRLREALAAAKQIETP